MNEKIVFSIFSVVVFASLCLFVVGEDCKVPKKVVDYDWNATSTDSLYLPIGQRNDTGLMKQILYESNFNPDEDLAKLCFRMQLKEDSISVSGANGTSALFNCKRLDSKKWILDCQHSSNKKEYNFKLYVTLTDKKSFGLALRCWENGLRGWTVFSTKKFLHDDVHFQILEHAKGLGFDSTEALPLRYKSCPKD